MPSHYKYYELYSMGCLTAKTERMAISFAFGSLLMNTFLLPASLQSEPLWGVGPPALFYMVAALALFYAGWADQPSYCWLYLVINGLSIGAFALTFVAAFLLDLNPKLFTQMKDQLGDQFADDSVQGQLRQLQLALLLLVAVQWMVQGLVWHYYRYLSHRKAEHFYADKRAPMIHPRCGSFRISPVKRLQIGGQIQNGKSGQKLGAV